MAVKLPSFRLLPSAGAKSRILGVIVAIAVVLGGGWFLVHWLSGPETAGGNSQVAGTPGGLQSVPGGNSSPEYYRAVMAANAEATRQAQMSGGSAVPTLLNVPSAAQPGFQPQQNCTVLCPDRSKVDVKSDIDELLRAEKISRTDANALLALSGKNVPVDEYAAALDALVREGKLTPAEARALLEKYKKQHQNALLDKSGVYMDGLVKNGQMSVDEATRLLALQQNGITTAGWASALKNEAKEGRLSAALVSGLLGQYSAEQSAECASEGAFRLRQFVSQGAMTGLVGKDLADLQARNVSASAYATKLSALVTEGKLTPAVADSLGKLYRQQRACGGTSEALGDIIQQQQALAANCVLSKVGSPGGLLRADADALVGLQQQGVSWARWQDAVSGLQKSAKLTGAQAAAVLPCYRALLALNEEAKRLEALQSDNASCAVYGDELKHAVQSRVMTPQMAGDLMQDCVAMRTPLTAPLIPGVETNIPGTEDFARLQQRVQQQQGAGAPGGNLAAAAAQFQAAQAAENEKERKAREERLQTLEAAMIGQAQTLIAAWQQAPMMRHVAGQAERGTAGRKGPAGPKAGVALGGARGAAGAGQAEEAGPPLIKAGTIYYAVLTTAVDSDYPDTPVMATVVDGPFKGAKLLGKLSLAQGQDRVSLAFSMMDEDTWAKTKTISAYAIDPDTARTVMATSVDHHYLLRYGGLFAASFLTGYSTAIRNAGEATTGIFGTSTTTPALSPGNRIAVAMGQVGTALTSNMQGLLTTPATVKITSGVGIGILFVADVTA